MSTRTKQAYIGGITGLKALAALMVVFYHLRFTFAQGGLLGVTVFFVASGFLITRNLLREAEKNGKIRFDIFWQKRIRRILPAVICMIVITILLTAIFNRVLFSKACRDILSVLFGYNNWWQIFNQVSYFENAGAPSPLTHCWSLAIEIQFYLIISVLFLFTASRQNRKQILSAVCIIGSLISMALMWVLFEPAADPSRVYYGTDTRIFSLFAGSLIALKEKELKNIIGGYSLIADVTGLAALGALIVMTVRISGYSSFMYRGGQILATGLICLIIIVMLSENSLLSRALSLQPLKWTGEHSYGIYLWHYPLILLFTNGEKSGFPAAAGAIGATLLMTAVSDLFVETPFGTDLVLKGIQIIRSKPRSAKAKSRQKRVRNTFLTVGTCELLLVISAVLCVFLIPKETALANTQELEKQAEEAAKITEEKIKEKQEKTPEPTTETGSVKTDEEICNDIDLLLIGDSVALGAAEEFYEVFPNSICDAAVSRYTTESYSIYDVYRYEHGWNGDGVIFTLGANGMLYDSLEMMREKAGDKPLFLMTAKAPHTEWAEINNQEMRDFAAANANTYVIDWYTASQGHDEYFADDDTHLNPSGAEAYVQCIRDAVLAVFGNGKE